MFSCDYTNNTTYTFYDELCDNCGQGNINYVGTCTERNLKTTLLCGAASDMWVQLFVPQILDIPTQKPNMEGICTVNTGIQIISQRVVKTPKVTGYLDSNGDPVDGDTIDNAEGTRLTGKKLIIEGIIQQKVVYTSMATDQALHSATFMIPFSAFIIVDGATPLTKKFQISAIVEDVFACALSERSLFSNNTIFIKAVPVC